MKKLIPPGMRKFTLHLIALLSAIGLCSLSKLSGAEFVTALSIILAVHAGGNITDKKLNGPNGNG